jgi:hypothetical protein
MLAPHVPADWMTFGIRNVHVGQASVDFQYRKTRDSATVEVTRKGDGECVVEFSPAFSLRTEIVSVELNGKPLPFKIQANDEDQHVSMRFPVHGGANSVVIHMKNDFGLTLANELPPLGSTSRGLRVISSSWSSSRDRLTLEVSGVPGRDYELGIWNPEQVGSVEGAVLTKQGKLHVEIPDGKTPADKRNGYVHRVVVIHFRKG